LRDLEESSAAEEILEVGTPSFSSLAQEELPTSAVALHEITEIIDILHKRLKARLRCLCKNNYI